MSDLGDTVLVGTKNKVIGSLRSQLEGSHRERQRLHRAFNDLLDWLDERGTRGNVVSIKAAKAKIREVRGD